MSERHLIVYRRDNAWQFTFRGTVTAPFVTREDAIEAAIAEARQLSDPDMEVIVQDADMVQETVWRGGQD
ncbi:DUF2188 domain-containing protein [Devosia chinhatensis]|uniref:DUF2188 domain-containing protein n=1 Tax=Devosia chinhatensis TaxID=429727 RepID=A0A0F5FL89_9HYPH|nr:DUF2188 domain-containing protein [Devosia chinhatensis]KKB09335.1 hypothetical protein VE26_05110 [Devosia chinhatensis]